MILAEIKKKETARKAVSFLCTIILMLLCLLPKAGLGQENEVQIDKLYNTIAYLASDSLQGRPTGTEYEALAAEYILAALKSNKVKPYQKAFYHSFLFTDLGSNNIESNNVVAWISNKQSKTILISAHYDHLAMNSLKSNEILLKNQIHNGADDNASGVALSLLLAEQFSKTKKKIPFNIIFAFYSGHELGLYGSEAFVQELAFNEENIALVLNFDMVGRLDENTNNLSLNVFNIDSIHQNKLNTLQDKTDLKLWFRSDANKKSDDFYFRQNGYPSISVTTGTHEDYHKSTDDIDKINFEGILKINQLILNLLEVYK